MAIAFSCEDGGEIVASGCTLPDFPHLFHSLKSINGKSHNTTLDQVKMEIICSETWPVALEFAPPLSPSISTHKRCKLEGKWDLLPLSLGCCTPEELETMKRKNGLLSIKLMHKLITFLMKDAKRHSVVVWEDTTKVYQVGDLFSGSCPSDFVLLPYQLNEEQWNLAIMTKIKFGHMTMLRMTEQHGELELVQETANDEVFKNMILKLSKRYPDMETFPAPVSVCGNGFAILLFALKFVKEFKQFQTMEDLQEAILTWDWPIFDPIEVQSLQDEVLIKLENLLSQALLPTDKLPALPGTFPLATASYRELWNLFHTCDEGDFIKQYLRPVPQGINMTLKYAKPPGLSILEKRKLVWGDCETYLKTKYSF
ncbi:hypothetical protein BASA81_015362 [Batrachochytrium salamandrivorans]|nr:hypothetical protein BASA81_015362 [Batrachochytrium salamandrivorans]